MRTMPMGSDVAVRFRKVKDEDGVAMITGTGTYQLIEKSTGTVVTNGSLTNVSTATEGRYRAVIERAITSALVRKRIYRLRGYFTQDGKDAEKEQLYTADYLE